MQANRISVIETLKDAGNAEKRGDLEEATILYAKVLSALPNHKKSALQLKKIHKKLGGNANLSQVDVNRLVELIHAGHMVSAVSLGSRLAVIAPKEPVVHNFLGIALMQTGEFGRAEISFRNALRLRSDYIEALGNIGSVLVHLKKPEEALTFLKRAVSLKPDYIEGLTSTGSALFFMGNFPDALDMFNSALKINPNHVSAINGKGVLLREMQRYDDAINTYQSGLVLEPDNQEILINLASVYSIVGMLKEALFCFEMVIRDHPDNADAFLRRGIALGQLGEPKLALDSIANSLSIKPEFAEAHRVQTLFQKSKIGDIHIIEMEKLLEENSRDSDTQMHLGFALGKAHEDIGDLKNAFRYWKIGNQERKKLLSYSISYDRDLAERIQGHFDISHFEKYSGYQDLTERPIFIVGMMRSGTTMVEQILASQGQVFGADELNFINNAGQSGIDCWGGDSVFDYEGFSKGYLDDMVPEAKAAPYFTDKMPVNFRWIGLIKTVFPNSRIINLNRDPRDIALSIYKNYFDNSGNGYSYDLKDIGEFYLIYLKLMEHWRTVLPGQIYDISYENVVGNLESEARKLLQYCGLSWNDKILEFHKTQRQVKTASINQVRMPLYRTSLRKWETVANELVPFISILEKAGALHME